MSDKDVIDLVSKATCISKHRILAQDRHDDVVCARFMVYYILHYVNGISLNRIGKMMNRTHAAVINGITVVKTWDKENRFRDPQSIRNGAILEELMDKIRQ